MKITSGLAQMRHQPPYFFVYQEHDCIVFGNMREPLLNERPYFIWLLMAVFSLDGSDAALATDTVPTAHPVRTANFHNREELAIVSAIL
jgi:hypothetical protein